MKTKRLQGTRGFGARRRGSAMAATVILILIASALAGTVAVLTTQSARMGQRTTVRERALAIADAHLEYAFDQWRERGRANKTVTLSGSNFLPLAAPPSSVVPTDGFQVSNYAITALDLIQDVSGPGKPTRTSTTRSGTSSMDAAWYYQSTVDVSGTTSTGAPVVVRARRVLEKLIRSPWRYAIFYDQDLEIHPGPDFQVNGHVHSNNSVFAITGGGSKLTFLDKVTYVNQYLQQFMASEMVRRGYSKKENGKDVPDYTKLDPVQKPIYPNGNAAKADAYAAPFEIYPDQFNKTDQNPNNDSYREIIEKPDPAFEDTFVTTLEDAGKPRMYDQADVRIDVAQDGTVTMRNAQNVVITGASKGNDKKLYDAFAGAVSVGKTIQDNREGATVRIVDIDLSKVDLNGTAFNGVVYVSDSSASASVPRGVRLMNGAVLPQDGLTVVSDNPVYIQGDYNTGGSNANKKTSASVMADAVNILSNAWSDSNSAKDLKDRKASNTTVNAAILSGLVPSLLNASDPKNSRYSGGVENFPRFLEDWGGRTLTYNGSMVCLFESQQATGGWGKGNVYGAPTRVWAFDPRFLIQPPPGNFVVTQYKKQIWYLD